MDRRKFLKEFGAAVTVACTGRLWAAQRTEKRNVPNILYIMSDDHAAHAISAYKSRLAKIAPTPNIDRLANEGILFENCFCTNSICVPSRATILTGQYSQTNGALDLGGRLEPRSLHSIIIACYRDRARISIRFSVSRAGSGPITKSDSPHMIRVTRRMLLPIRRSSGSKAETGRSLSF